MSVLCVSTDVICFYPSCSGDGRIRAKDWGSVSWHPSRLQRIVGEAGMLRLRKVSVRNISTAQLYPSHCFVKCVELPDILFIQHTDRQTWQKSCWSVWAGSMWPAWPFVCDLCSPVPSISWRRADGNPLPGKIKINHSSGVLEIPYFRPEDAGMYECVAENSRGRNVARGQLLFHSKNRVDFCFLFHGDDC